MRSSLNPTALIGLVFLLIASVFAATSDWSSVFLAVHISFVVIWIGGGSLLMILALIAERTDNETDLAAIARQAAFAGEKIFAPAAVVVVLMGITMTIHDDIGFGHFWVIFGLLGFATTFFIGIAVLSPMSKKISTLLEAGGAGTPEVRDLTSKILLIARADTAMLLLVVVDMVTKPFS